MSHRCPFHGVGSLREVIEYIHGRAVRSRNANIVENPNLPVKNFFSRGKPSKYRGWGTLLRPPPNTVLVRRPNRFLPFSTGTSPQYLSRVLPFLILRNLYFYGFLECICCFWLLGSISSFWMQEWKPIFFSLKSRISVFRTFVSLRSLFWRRLLPFSTPCWPISGRVFSFCGVMCAFSCAYCWLAIGESMFIRLISRYISGKT